MKFRKRDWLLIPLYLHQARTVKKSVISLDEPSGDRTGSFVIDDSTQDLATIRLMVIGDSAGAGVGVATQSQAALGRLIFHLAKHLQGGRFGRIDYQLHATSGHTSHQILARLYALSARPVETVVISMGVNDVLKQTSDRQWQDNIEAIIQILVRKFSAKQIIFLSLPPMHLMPALPRPLNHFIQAQAARLDRLLADTCQADQTGKAMYLLGEFSLDEHSIDKLFASDGFHPSAITYDLWAQVITKAISQRFDQKMTSTRPNTDT